MKRSRDVKKHEAYANPAISRVRINKPLHLPDESVVSKLSMLHIMNYNHPSDEELSSPRDRYIAHANICIVKTDDDEDDVKNNKVDNAPVLVPTMSLHHAAFTMSTDFYNQ